MNVMKYLMACANFVDASSTEPENLEQIKEEYFAIERLAKVQQVIYLYNVWVTLEVLDSFVKNVNLSGFSMIIQ